MDMDKELVFKAVVAETQERLRVVTNSARQAHEAATHPDSKPENKYDTRGVEASYLAGAQSKRIFELQHLLDLYRSLKLQYFSEYRAIGVTALVTLQREDRSLRLFILPKGGGETVTVEGVEISTVTPESPLGKSLIDAAVGDEIKVGVGPKALTYEITELQ